MKADIHQLMAEIHQRLDSGIDIQTFADGTTEIRWRRMYPGGELSDERFTTASNLVAALNNVLETENEADAADDREEGVVLDC